MILPDIIRILCLFEGCIAIGLCLVAMWCYLRFEEDDEALFPSYVFILLFGLIGLCVIGGLFINLRLGQDQLSWKAILLLASYSLVDTGLLLLSTNIYRRSETRKNLSENDPGMG